VTNTRPRDALGRPLPYGSTGVPPLPDDAALPPAQTLAEAQRLLDTGLLFQAHEVLEAAWKVAPEPERDLWRGLAQLAVGVTHLARGNAIGGVALLRRGAANLGPYQANYQAGAPHGIDVDVPGLVRWANGLAAAVDDQRRSAPASAPRFTVPRLGRAGCQPTI
jgi:hypothetical protein